MGLKNFALTQIYKLMSAASKANQASRQARKFKPVVDETGTGQDLGGILQKPTAQVTLTKATNGYILSMRRFKYDKQYGGVEDDGHDFRVLVEGDNVAEAVAAVLITGVLK